MQGRPTGVVAACKDINLGREIQELFASPNMRVNTTTDVTGTDGRTLACLAVAVVCVWVILACSPVNNLSAKRVLTCVGLRASCLDVRRHRCGPCVDVPLAGSVSVHVVLTVSNVWRCDQPLEPCLAAYLVLLATESALCTGMPAVVAHPAPDAPVAATICCRWMCVTC